MASTTGQEGSGRSNDRKLHSGTTRACHVLVVVQAIDHDDPHDQTVVYSLPPTHPFPSRLFDSEAFCALCWHDFIVNVLFSQPSEKGSIISFTIIYHRLD